MQCSPAYHVGVLIISLICAIMLFERWKTIVRKLSLPDCAYITVMVISLQLWVVHMRALIVTQAISYQSVAHSSVLRFIIKKQEQGIEQYNSYYWICTFFLFLLPHTHFQRTTDSVCNFSSGIARYSSMPGPSIQWVVGANTNQLRGGLGAPPYEHTAITGHRRLKILSPLCIWCLCDRIFYSLIKVVSQQCGQRKMNGHQTTSMKYKPSYHATLIISVMKAWLLSQ